MRAADPVVVPQPGRVLIDRQTLARLTRRSVHTIRARCPVAARDPHGRPLYDMDQAEAILKDIPTRRRRRVVDHAA
jgi:hypothetical protein